MMVLGWWKGLIGRDSCPTRTNYFEHNDAGLEIVQEARVVQGEWKAMFDTLLLPFGLKMVVNEEIFFSNAFPL